MTKTILNFELIKKNGCIKHHSNYSILGVNEGLFTNGCNTKNRASKREIKRYLFKD